MGTTYKSTVHLFIKGQSWDHVETSQMVLTGSYMMATFAFNELSQYQNHLKKHFFITFSEDCEDFEFVHINFRIPINNINNNISFLWLINYSNKCGL